MSKRIHVRDLAAMSRLINKTLGQELDRYVRCTDGSYSLIKSVGHYYVDYSNGGARLEQICEGGGSRDISPRGTKRQTYEFMRAFLKGIEAAAAKGGEA